MPIARKVRQPHRLICNDDLEAKPGIYAIWSPDKKSAYIGASKNIRIRFEQHRTNLHAGRNTCWELLELYQRGGIFTFRVVEYCSLAELSEKEAAGFTKCAGYGVKLINHNGRRGAGLRGIGLKTIDQIANYISLDLAAQMLGIAKPRVRQLVQDGLLEGIGFNGGIVVDVDSVQTRLSLYPAGENHHGAHHKLKREGRL